ncbi:hypothetical protein [Acinetobacter piscicola]|uniref:hypothetical protein n=1 Tax=Acinetobacter piscicola TaxID=2006115 RepID=UPI0010209FF3|nr:hypothetical protein [Acinetobacter piscicola]RYL25292.1 hypothetical protein EWP19_12320 [Acinetobacter piscicola]
MAAIRLNWQNIQHYIWLIMGLLCFVAALIFWAMTDTKELVEVSNPIEETQVQIQPEKVAATTHLGALMDEVRPLEMTTRVVASGNHEPEFRGTKFFEENKKNYIIELFKSSNEDVIRGFLLKQADRKNLIYFRLSAEDQAEQYVMAYGVYKNDDQAKAALQQLTTLKLPNTIQPQVVGLDQYASLVNDLGSEEMLGGNKLYNINLRPAALPIIDESLLAQPKPVAPSSSSTTKTVAPTTSTPSTAPVNKDPAATEQKRPITTTTPTTNTTTAPTIERKPTTQEISDPFN